MKLQCVTENTYMGIKINVLEMFPELETLEEEIDNFTVKTEIIRKVLPASFQRLTDGKCRLFTRVLNQIIIEVKNKEFNKAEKLRGSLYRINPTASSIIYRTGLFIKEEKYKTSHQANGEPQKAIKPVIEEGIENCKGLLGQQTQKVKACIIKGKSPHKKNSIFLL